MKTLLVLLSLILVSCATKTVRLDDGRLVEVKKAHEDIYKQMEEDYRVGNYKKVIAGADSFISSTEESPIFFKVFNLKGLAYAQIADFNKSLEAFNNALREAPAGSMKNTILYNKAKVLSLKNEDVEVIKTIGEIVLKKSSKEDQIRFLSLELQSLNKTGSKMEALKVMGELADLSLDLKIDNTYIDQMKAEVNNFSRENLESLKNEIRSRSLLAMIYDRLIILTEADKQFSKAGALKIEKARRLGGIIDLSTEEKEGKLPDANSSQFIVHSNARFRDNTIAIFLPMSGDKKDQGDRIKNMIETLQRTDGDIAKINFLYKDTKGTVEGAAAAAKEVVQQDGASLILGPFNSQQATAVKEVIQSTDAILISYSVSPNFEPKDRIFQFAMLPNKQIKTVLDYASSSLGVHDLAFVRSDDKFGEQWESSFWEALKENHLKVKGYGVYQSTQTDFRDLVEDISGISDTVGRQNEWEELRKVREAEQRAGKKKKEELRLPPDPGFDGIYIPDYPKIVGQIAPTIKYEDMRNVRILGPSMFNDYNLIERAGKHIDGAIFCDLVVKKPDDYIVESFGHKPPEVTTEKEPLKIITPQEYFASDEAIVYLTLNMFAKMFTTTKITSYDQLIGEINARQSFPTSGGNILLSSNYFNPVLTLLTVKSGKIVQVQ